MILSPFVPRQLQLLRVRNYPSVPIRDKHELPHTSGVYFAMRGWRCMYIGKSTSIYHRWNSYRYGEHHRLDELLTIDETIGDVDIHYQEWPEPLIGFIEAIEIKRFSPPMNKRKESVWDNVNLSVIGFVLKSLGTQILMALLSSAVIWLLLYHLVFAG